MTKRSPVSGAVRAGFSVLLAVAGAVGCRSEQTVGSQTKDATIEAQVKAKLATDVGAATVTGIEVNVTNGVVTLAGPVGSENDRQAAEAAARSIEGVTGVNNNLQVTVEVVPPPGTTAPPTPIGGYPPSVMTPMSMGTTPAAPPMAGTPEMAMPPPTPAASPNTTPY